MTTHTIESMLTAKAKKLAREILVPLANHPFLDRAARPLQWVGAVRHRLFPQLSAAVPVAKAASDRAPMARVAAVLDEYFIPCLLPDCDLILPGPDDYRALLAAQRPDFLLVFSAWHGNNNAWDEQIALYPKRLWGDLRRLTNWCRGQGIPTVFWNIEDPVHFERFLGAARCFDCVCTTDADSVPRYKSRSTGPKVLALPFAAQPAIHNPIGARREHPVCFAGTYWVDRYPKRRRDLELLLDPAMDFGLHIFDRHHGATGRYGAQYRFPERFHSAVKGGLSYQEMLQAYKQYRVFLNVNTVDDSPTMFANRVFELLACGTPVISSYARGIEELLGEDAVTFSASESETRRHLEKLLGDEEHWARVSCRGMRKVLSGHTYADRLCSMGEAMGLNLSRCGRARQGALVRIKTTDELRRVHDTLQRQTRRPDRLLVMVGEALDRGRLTILGSVLEASKITALPLLLEKEPSQLLEEIKKVGVDWVSLLDPDVYYGPRYLEDGWRMQDFANADLLGKGACYRWKSRGGLSLHGKGREFQYTKAIHSASVMARLAILTTEDLLQLLREELFDAKGRACLSLDRHHFVPGVLAAGDRGERLAQAASKADA